MELVVAVALVGLLAAVVLPVANRFSGSGSEEARLTEFHDLVTAVVLLMADNKLDSIPNPVTGSTQPCTVGTKLLTGFPDTDSDSGQGAGSDGGKALDFQGSLYVFTGPPDDRDKQGYVLSGHDAVAGDGQAVLVNYVHQPEAAYCYTADGDGTVHQYAEDGTEQTS